MMYYMYTVVVINVLFKVCVRLYTKKMQKPANHQELNVGIVWTSIPHNALKQQISKLPPNKAKAKYCKM